MLRGTLCVLLGSLILLGCGGAIRLQPLPADHPATPEAPEAPMQASPKTGDQQESSADAAYTCPMHPEVRELAPGSWPKCGMARKWEDAT